MLSAQCKEEAPAVWTHAGCMTTVVDVDVWVVSADLRLEDLHAGEYQRPIFIYLLSDQYVQ